MIIYVVGRNIQNMDNLVPFVYPGALVQIGDMPPITVTQFEYRFYGHDGTDIIIIYDDGNHYRLSSEDTKVKCLSDSHTELSQLFTCLDPEVFRPLMSFLSGDHPLSAPHIFTREKFDRMISKQCETFAYFLSAEPREQFMTHVEKRFNETFHDKECSLYKIGVMFDNEHVCDTVAHLRTLIMIISNNTIHITKNNCIGAVEIIRGAPQYIHITPGGSLIIGTYGQGCCKHPLTRILFWTAMLKKHPDFMSLFTDHYLIPLISDLKRHNFICCTDYNSLQDIIKDFDLDACILCRKASLGKRQVVRSWGRSNYNYDNCGHNNCYNYHLLLLAVLRNGWKGDSDHGRTTLNYRGVDLDAKFDCGDNLSFGPVCGYVYYIRGSFSTFLDFVLPIDNISELEVSDDDSASDSSDE